MTWHWLVHLSGADDVSGAWYGFWSGFAGILERLIELGAIGFILLRKHNCHQPRCPRIGRHTVDGSPWCDKHHESARTK